jgi:hypothetical protein
MLMIVGLGEGILGCGSAFPGQAQKTFAMDTICPLERITVRERDDLPKDKIPEVADAYGDTSATPPADVAADPGRLQFWDESRAARAEEGATRASLYHIEEVTGCGQTRLYACVGYAGYHQSARYECNRHYP